MVNFAARAAAAGVVFAASISLAGVALAATDNTPATGPGTAACLTAQDVVKLRVSAAAKATVKFQNAASQLSAADQAKIDLAVTAFDDAKADLDAALAALKTAPTETNATAAQKAGEQLTVAAAALIAATGEDLAGAKQTLITANAALQVALAGQAKACDGPTPTATATPAPTSTPSSTVTTTVTPTTAPVVAAQLPTAIDTGVA